MKTFIQTRLHEADKAGHIEVKGYKTIVMKKKYRKKRFKSFYGRTGDRLKDVLEAKSIRRKLNLNKHSSPAQIVDALQDNFTMENFNQIYCLGGL